MKKIKSGMQWKVLSGLNIREIERTCEEWTGKGWTVFAILGIPQGTLSIVLNRILVLWSGTKEQP